MANTPKVYVICDQNCKFEGMTKEQIYTAIIQAVNEGTISDIDVGFIQTIKTINGTPLKFFVGTQYEYDILSAADKENLFAIITNDATRESILAAVESLQENVESLHARVDGMEKGTVTVKNATNASKATHDNNGNVIAETYGNFDGAWRSGGMAYPQLSGAGTYQFIVKVDYNSIVFESSAVIYWSGERHTIITLPTACNVTYNKIYHYRLIVSADGSTHIQYFEADVRNGNVSDWMEIEYFDATQIKNNVSVNFRKIL